MSKYQRFAGGILVFALLAASVPCLSAMEGWYLLTPPQSDYNEHAEYLKGYKILDTEPLSQWIQKGAYDSASECEAGKNSFILTEQNLYSKSSQKYLSAAEERKDSGLLDLQRRITEGHNSNVFALIASRCIKSDDKRLQK